MGRSFSELRPLHQLRGVEPAMLAVDKIRSRVKHNGENRVDAAVWDPSIVIRDPETAQRTTANSP